MIHTYRADLHVHSRFSNKPSTWAIRKINCPESYTSPEFIYNTAKAEGMDYVTITDHNTINGALEIAHLPGTFVSVEATAYFPESGCKVHVVCLDITETMYREIMRLRKNIFELTAYLRQSGITHFVAHAFYDLNDRLNADIIEQLFLLFNVIEVKNGARAARFNDFIKAMTSSLAKETIERFAEKHDIAPYGERPWEKAMVGGSDDHSGFFISRAHTATHEGESLKDFISSINRRKSWAAGKNGDPLTLAHSVYGIGYRFYTEKIKGGQKSSTVYVNFLLNKCFQTQPAKMPLFDRIKFFFRKNLPEMFYSYDKKSFEEILDSEARRLLNDKTFLDSLSTDDKNRKIFEVTSYLANRMIFIYTDKMLKSGIGNGIIEMFRAISTIGIVHTLISPYYIAYYHQHRSKDIIRHLRTRLPSMQLPELDDRIALFTDTLNEINGVAKTIKRLIATSKIQGIDLSVISCSNDPTGFMHGVMNFKSIGDFELPEYPELRLHFPPILDVIDYFEREGFTRIHASTPGTLGLMALLIAKLMNMPISATYHTDIPQYVGSLTNDGFLENTAWQYIIWFYNQMDEVLVPSRSTERQLVDRGLDPSKVKPLPRWVDADMFSPSKRDDRLWKKYSMDGEVKFLYVGRVSREKNLEILADAYVDITKQGFKSSLVIVGDGPYREELEQKLKDHPVLFTGFLAGEELSTIYASSDVFVFPSTTDTFGNVVLEAQASGLPVIVTDEGGPHELMSDNETGYIVRAKNSLSLAETMLMFLKNKEDIRSMGLNARKFIETNAPDTSEVYNTILYPQNNTEVAHA